MATYKELLAQREALEKQIASAMEAEKTAAIDQVRALVAEFGLSASDCGFSGRKEKSSKPSGNSTKRTVSIKYVGPTGEVWRGRGRTPKWITALEAQGRSRNEFLTG